MKLKQRNALVTRALEAALHLHHEFLDGDLRNSYDGDINSFNVIFDEVYDIVLENPNVHQDHIIELWRTEHEDEWSVK